MAEDRFSIGVVADDVPLEGVAGAAVGWLVGFVVRRVVEEDLDDLEVVAADVGARVLVAGGAAGGAPRTDGGEGLGGRRVGEGHGEEEREHHRRTLPFFTFWALLPSSCVDMVGREVT